MIFAYKSGSVNAILAAAYGVTAATIATIIIGKIIRIPKTAINIPHVRKRCRQTSSISFNFFALTTALSNDNEISKIHKIDTMVAA